MRKILAIGCLLLTSAAVVTTPARAEVRDDCVRPSDYSYRMDYNSRTPVEHERRDVRDVRDRRDNERRDVRDFHSYRDGGH